MHVCKINLYQVGSSHQHSISDHVSNVFSPFAYHLLSYSDLAVILVYLYETMSLNIPDATI